MSSPSLQSSSVPLVLSDLTRGQKAVITAIDPDHSGGDMHLRLHEMGFDEGIEIEVIQQGPFGGDPLAVSVDGVVIALRRREARSIRVMLASTAEIPVPSGVIAPAVAGASS